MSNSKTSAKPARRRHVVKPRVVDGAPVATGAAYTDFERFVLSSLGGKAALIRSKDGAHVYLCADFGGASVRPLAELPNMVQGFGPGGAAQALDERFADAVQTFDDASILRASDAGPAHESGSDAEAGGMEMLDALFAPGGPMSGEDLDDDAE